MFYHIMYLVIEFLRVIQHLGRILVKSFPRLREPDTFPFLIHQADRILLLQFTDRSRNRWLRHKKFFRGLRDAVAFADHAVIFQLL